MFCVGVLRLVLRVVVVLPLKVGGAPWRLPWLLPPPLVVVPLAFLPGVLLAFPLALGLVLGLVLPLAALPGGHSGAWSSWSLWALPPFCPLAGSKTASWNVVTCRDVQHDVHGDLAEGRA